MAATPEDHELAARLAAGAGELLVGLRADLLSSGADAATLKDSGDRAGHDWLVAELAAARPDDAVLSEEATALEERTSDRLAAERVWVIDPLDGTREYGEQRSDWAVHVALAVGGVPVAGAVALPDLGEVHSTASPTTVPHPPARLRVVMSRTRRPPVAVAVADALGAEVVEMGSAGAKTMSILRGEADVYPHAGGQYEWDSCAPVAVARAAGLHCSRIDGSELTYNRPDPWLPDLLVCRAQHAEAVLGAIASAGTPR